MKHLLRPAIWLLGQLTFPRKLALVGILFLIPLALLAALLLPRLNADIAFAERELVGVQAIKPIKILTLQAQAQRGTIQLILNGDQDARERLADIQANAEAAITVLDEFDQRHGAQLNTSDNWAKIKSKWGYLRDNALALPADKNFLLHTDFISGLNVFLSKLADTSGLSLDWEISSYYVGRMVIDHLPDLIESLGQTRALSAGAAQRKSLTPVERHQLSVQVGEAEESEKKLVAQFGKAMNAFPDIRNRLQSSLPEATESALFFISSVKDEILLTDKITASGQTLYDAGTLAIDAAYRLCDSTLPVLQELIRERQSRLETERRLIFALTAIALALVAYLFIGFSVGVFDNLATLKEAASRVAGGDFHAYAGIASRDEMHDIANSFNRMTDSLRSTVSLLRTSEEKYRNIMEQAGDMILLSDSQGRLLDANRMVETLLGYSRGELLTMRIDAIICGKGAGESCAHSCQAIGTGKPCGEELYVLCKDGRTVPVQVNCAQIEYGGGQATLSILRDISAARESRRRIEHMATHDTLTGLANRALFYDRIQLSLVRASRQIEPLAVMFIDLDNFKTVNDTLGHDLGDSLLQEVARRIQGCVGAGDTAARLGGDEFVLLIAGADRSAASAMAQSLVAALAEPFLIDDHEIRVTTASIGVSLYPQDGLDRHALMKSADAAMYRAKGAGRNTFRFFSEA